MVNDISINHANLGMQQFYRTARQIQGFLHSILSFYNYNLSIKVATKLFSHH